ncbi:hypothetical protein RAA17_07995 [Komagataeibacter rhaeticus]|nr:hypothetical protein [Komagataeibacter rhaeticus]
MSTGSIFRLMPDRVYQKIVTDPRLHWPGGSFATKDGQLYVPAAQLDRTAPLNGGVNAIQWPVHIYRINTGSLPPPNSDTPRGNCACRRMRPLQRARRLGL